MEIKPVQITKAHLTSYKKQSPNIVRRKLVSSSTQYSNICIMTDADVDG